VVVENAPCALEVVAMALLFRCSESFFIVGVAVSQDGGIERRYEGINELGEGVVDATWARRGASGHDCVLSVPHQILNSVLARG
jgi:hypothetical protein